MCPIATLKSAYYVDETKEQMTWSYETVGRTVVPVSTNGYSLTHGVVKVNQKSTSFHCNTIESLMIYFFLKKTNNDRM